MDRPQEQIFRGKETSYRYMSYPPQKQKLQLLYPGRFMEGNYDFTGDNIPNEDPVGLEYTREINKALSKAAAMELEALERHLGGKHKVVQHPAVEPEAPVEDPRLSGVSIDPQVNPNLEKVPSKYDHMKKIFEENIKDENIINKLEKTEPHPIPQGIKDWRIPPIGVTNQQKGEELGIEGYKYVNNSIKMHNTQKYRVSLWGLSGLIGILFVFFIFLLIYGITKKNVKK